MNLSKEKYRLLLCFVLVFVFSGSSWMVNSPAAGGDDSPVCTDCHGNKQNGKYVHYPAGEGNCEVCHAATPEHRQEGGPGGMITNRTAAACYQCHDAKNAGPYVHPTPGMDGECVQCHDPHASDQSALLISCPTTLCLSCHDREITVQEGGKNRTVANIRQKVLEMQFVHEPAIWCTACHDSHGSKSRSLLAASFPVENYNKYEPGDDKTRNTFELCFGCHNQAMLNKNISANDTGFRHDTVRDGVVTRENLHWFHVVDGAGSEDKDRGRSCNICHDPHGSTNPHNIRSSWPMEKHNLVMVFAGRANGGACMKSCHSLKSYQRID